MPIFIAIIQSHRKSQLYKKYIIAKQQLKLDSVINLTFYLFTVQTDIDLFSINDYSYQKKM